MVCRRFILTATEKCPLSRTAVCRGGRVPGNRHIATWISINVITKAFLASSLSLSLSLVLIYSICVCYAESIKKHDRNFHLNQKLRVWLNQKKERKILAFIINNIFMLSEASSTTAFYAARTTTICLWSEWKKASSLMNTMENNWMLSKASVLISFFGSLGERRKIRSQFNLITEKPREFLKRQEHDNAAQDLLKPYANSLATRFGVNTSK